MKKIFAMMLAVIMMLGAVATSAFAEHECQCQKPCKCVKCECPKK